MSTLIETGSKVFWYLLMAKRYPGSFRKARFLHECEPKPREELEAIQFKEVRRLIAHAYKTSEFYKERFMSHGLHPDDIRDWESYSLIPPLTKEEIQSNRDRIVSSIADRRRLTRDATGGSTGQPLVFFYDQETVDWFVACDIYIKRRWGIRPWCRKAFLWGADRDIPEMTVKERLRTVLERERFLNSFNMEAAEIEEYADLLRNWHPEYVQGYASSLWFFADFAIRRGINIPQPRAVRSSAETLYDNQRTLIEKVFGENLFNFYGSREVTNLAAECVNHKGLHVFSPIRVLEVVDSEGRPVRAGEPGRIVVTDLVNRAMPFIRYDIGDVGVMAENECGCGCNFNLLREIIGRQCDLIKTREGKFIHGEFFTHLFYALDGISRFQVHQKDFSNLDIHIVKTEGFDPAVMMKIRAKVEERTNFTMNVSVKLVDEIPGVLSGKHRFTISEVGNSFHGERLARKEGSRAN